jgi:hypothetical protein
MVAALDPKESAPASHDQKYRTRLPETELVAGWCEMAAIEGSLASTTLGSIYAHKFKTVFDLCRQRKRYGLLLQLTSS